MDPNIESPQGPADEISVVVGDAEVVDSGDFIGRANRVNLNQLAIVADELFTSFQLPSRNECLLTST